MPDWERSPAYDTKNKEQQALTATIKARELFDTPLEQQMLPGYINHDQTNLIHGEAAMYGRMKMPSKGLEVFQQAIDMNHHLFVAKLSTTQRRHVHGLLDATIVALKLPNKLKDKELTVGLWKAGIQGAKQLQSEKLFDDAVAAYSIMESIWSDEQDVLDLYGLVQKDW